MDACKSLRPTAWCVSRTGKVDLGRREPSREDVFLLSVMHQLGQWHVWMPAALPSLTAHRASSVGELRESEEGSLLLLPFRWAAAQLGKESASG